MIVATSATWFRLFASLCVKLALDGELESAVWWRLWRPLERLDFECCIDSAVAIEQTRNAILVVEHQAQLDLGA